jgi:hypothetical protein
MTSMTWISSIANSSTEWCACSVEREIESIAASAPIAQFVVRSSRSRQLIIRAISPR